MRLNDPLVTSFSYRGEEYSIDLAFDNVLDVFDVLGDKSLRNQEKAEICRELLLGYSPTDQSLTVELWNYIYKTFIHIESKQPLEYDRQGNPMPVKKEDDRKLIDLEKDAPYIFASFQQAYQINLHREQGKLHWYEFQSLLNGLPSETIMQRIIQIRMWEPSKGESSEYKQAMRDLQNLYALDDEGAEEVDD